MENEREICSHCHEVVSSVDMVGRICRWCDDELNYETEDPLAGDVDRFVDPEEGTLVSVCSSGSDRYSEPCYVLNSCDICGEEIGPEEGILCHECQEELKK